MKNKLSTIRIVFALIQLILFLSGGIANSATTTVSYQISAGTDDGYAWSPTDQDISSGYLMIGDERTYASPYQMSAIRFNTVDIIMQKSTRISFFNCDHRLV